MYIYVMADNQNNDTYELSNGQIAALIGARFRDYRTALGLTQKEVAFQSGVSVMTIVRFEKGHGNAIRLDNLIALMRAIQRLDDIAGVVREMPQSLYHKKERR